MRYLPITSVDQSEMLKEIDVNSFEDLLQGMPAKLRNPKLNIPEALSETELQAELLRLGKKNKTAQTATSFLGAGSYEHFIPTAISGIVGRSEFYTAYTPYQPEASQGTLQTIFEFQSLVAELMNLDVSNASHYDGATSLAEAALLACRQTGRNVILVAKSMHPHYRKVLSTYLESTDFRIREIPFLKTGAYDREGLLRELDDNVAGVLIQSPNFFGQVENLDGIAQQVHEAGALLIMSVNPLSLGVYKSPGEWGADIAVGEGQPLGIPRHMGGPYLGLFATTKALMRKMPGRLAGMTVDTEGKRAFCLTLQAREQHIRREKAYSNICTNQALCALTACVYMTLMGKEGLKKVAELNLDRAYYLRDNIAKIPGFEVSSDPIFNEFLVSTGKDLASVLEKMEKKGIFPGVKVSEYYPEFSNAMLVCATETKTKDDLDTYLEALSQC